MKLLFVYNGEGNPLALLMGAMHKVVSPATHECALCSITHGVLRMDPRWKKWVRNLPFPVEFHHRREFRREFPEVRLPLPAVLIERDGVVETLINRLDLSALESVDALVALINRRLKGVRQQGIPVAAAPVAAGADG